MTNESVLFEAFCGEFDRSIATACKRHTGIKTSSQLELIGSIRDDEESLKDESEGAGKRQELEERRKKMMKLKAKKKKKKKPKGAVE